MKEFPQSELSPEEKKETDEIAKEMLSKWVPEEHKDDYNVPSVVKKTEEKPAEQLPDVSYTPEEKRKLIQERATTSSAALRSGKAEKALEGDVVQNEKGENVELKSDHLLMNENEKGAEFIEKARKEMEEELMAAKEKAERDAEAEKMAEFYDKGLQMGEPKKEEENVVNVTVNLYDAPKNGEQFPAKESRERPLTIKERLRNWKESLVIKLFGPKKKEKKTAKEPEAHYIPEKSDNLSIEENDKEKTGSFVKKEPWFWKSSKERIKGFFTIGWWEIHQAEKFRSSAKKVSRDVERLSERINPITQLSLEDAWAEAERIQAGLAQEGMKEGAGAKSENYEKLSNAISAEKRARNELLVEDIINDARRNLENRLRGYKGGKWFSYKDAGGNEVHNDPKKIAAMITELREKLLTLQNGAVEADAKEFAKIIRSNLDPIHWRRYVYGGIEALLAIGGIKLIFTSSISTAVQEGAKETVQIAREVIKMRRMVKIVKDPWTTTKLWLQQDAGIPDPTDQQIMAADKILSHTNGFGVKIWEKAGAPLDTQLSVDTMLDYGDVMKNIDWIKSLTSLF